MSERRFLSALCIIMWFRLFLLVGGVLLGCWRKCWQSTFVQNRREVQTLHFFSLNFKMFLLSSWCAFALVRFTHQKHSVRLRRTSSLDYITCFGRHKHSWKWSCSLLNKVQKSFMLNAKCYSNYNNKLGSFVTCNSSIVTSTSHHKCTLKHAWTWYDTFCGNVNTGK